MGGATDNGNDVEIKVSSTHGPKTNSRWEFWVGHILTVCAILGGIGGWIAYAEWRNHVQADHDAELTKKVKDEVTVDGLKTWLGTVATKQGDTATKVAGIESTVTAIKTDVDKAIKKVDDGVVKIDEAAGVARKNEKKLDEVLTTVKLVMSRQGVPSHNLPTVPQDAEVPKANAPK